MHWSGLKFHFALFDNKLDSKDSGWAGSWHHRVAKMTNFHSSKFHDEANYFDFVAERCVGRCCF